MGDKRRLNAEIERTTRKVNEGVETFEETWEKMQTAPNTNQKEKCETELKKEIKKLQRLREQIKSWLQSSEIKDKSTLMELRKRIEQKMEKFKEIERETKTKAYSKEGLQGGGQKLDPAIKKKEETTTWLSTTISSLSQQVEQYEGEIEVIMTAKKKKLDKEKQARVDRLKAQIERHKYHVKQLETIMRLVDNDALEPKEVSESIREHIDYYVDTNDTPDFEEVMDVYDELRLDEHLEDFAGGVVVSGSLPKDDDGMTPPSTQSGSPSPSPGLQAVTAMKEDEVATTAAARPKKIKAPSEERTPAAGVKPLLGAGGLKQTTPIKISPAIPTSSAILSTPPMSSMPASPTTVPPLLSLSLQSQPYSAAAAAAMPPPSTDGHHSTHQQGFQSQPLSSQGINRTPSIDASSRPHTPGNSTTAVAAQSAAASSPMMTPPASASAAPSAAGTPLTQHGPAYGQPMQPPAATLGTPVRPTPPSSAPPSAAQLLLQQQQQQQQQQNSLHTAVAQSVVGASVAAPVTADTAAAPSGRPTGVLGAAGLDAAPVASAPAGMALSLKSIAEHAVGQQQQHSLLLLSGLGSRPDAAQPLFADAKPQFGNVKILPNQGIAPLGPLSLTAEQKNVKERIEVSGLKLPLCADSEKLRILFPRQPIKLPAYYPKTPPPGTDTIDFFVRLNNETLFFIFYFMEGTKAQYLAAKALKVKSWRFHMKYMTWFQRHDDPKFISDDHEIGTYIYWDFERWTQGKKDDFTFEYRYLEDRELA